MLQCRCTMGLSLESFHISSAFTLLNLFLRRARNKSSQFSNPEIWSCFQTDAAPSPPPTREFLYAALVSALQKASGIGKSVETVSK